MRTPRQAARTVVLDPAGSVFLLRSDNSEIGVHWSPPGGGLDRGESPEQAATRELREETGWTDLRPGALLCTWEHDFTWHGTPVRQSEWIFLADGPHRTPQGDLSAVHTKDRILEWRWWTPQELAAPDAAQFWPPALPQLLAAVRAARAEGSPDPEAAHLGYLPNAPRPAGGSTGEPTSGWWQRTARRLLA
ncbi:NUDIX hydrolase [Streptomyces tateyamensis]|uniref:NUDIX hydrolase n=1 Tax=Streptomyces tateyamensis TaxID=565073 RepID=A0A2V4N3Y0_9ACTN|nr:NUDIX domain-containing protein [Streptomyces tateyamensis]PYC77498.1 NUDIX hydrolase [Streptomyces tateyamensis]